MREEGIVKWFNDRKGYGFILDTQGNDVFVHYNQIIGDGFRTLQENEGVTFVAEKSPKGLKATEVVSNTQAS